MMRGIRFDVKLPIKIEKGEKFYIASCPVLDVISQGKTLKKAKSNLHEALSLFLISCFERGVLDAVLKNCGFKSAVTPPRKDVQPLRRKNILTFLCIFSPISRSREGATHNAHRLEDT